MDRFAALCERVASYRSRLKKVGFVAEYLRTLDDDDLLRAVHFLCCGPLISTPSRENLFGQSDEVRPLSIGYATLREAYKAVTGWGDEVIAICHEEVGDTGETIGLLLPGHTRGEPMSLAVAQQLFTELHQANRTADKVAILSRIFAEYRPAAVKYFVKIITNS